MKTIQWRSKSMIKKWHDRLLTVLELFQISAICAHMHTCLVQFYNWNTKCEHIFSAIAYVAPIAINFMSFGITISWLVRLMRKMAFSFLGPGSSADRKKSVSTGNVTYSHIMSLHEEIHELFIEIAHLIAWSVKPDVILWSIEWKIVNLSQQQQQKRNVNEKWTT